MKPKGVDTRMVLHALSLLMSDISNKLSDSVAVVCNMKLSLWMGDVVMSSCELSCYTMTSFNF